RAGTGYSLDGEPSVAEGAGLTAHRHRQDHERRSGVEPGIKASPVGSHPRQFASSPEPSGPTAASRAPRAGLGQWLAEPTQQPAAAGHDALPQGMPASPDPTAGRTVTIDTPV